MDILPVEPGKSATIVIENPDDVQNISPGLNFVNRAILKYKAYEEVYPITFTFTLTELSGITDKIANRADREFKRGAYVNAQSLRNTAAQLGNHIIERYEP